MRTNPRIGGQATQPVRTSFKRALLIALFSLLAAPWPRKFNLAAAQPRKFNNELASRWQPRCHGFLALDRWLCVPAFQRVCPKSARLNMPKMKQRYKRNESRNASINGSRLSNPTDSVKGILANLTGDLKRVSEQRHRQDFWRDWLEAHLPAQITGKITGIVERDGTLVIFAESAAWSARLRFATQEIEKQILTAKSGVTAVSVRVLPRGAKS